MARKSRSDDSNIRVLNSAYQPPGTQVIPPVAIAVGITTQGEMTCNSGHSHWPCDHQCNVVGRREDVPPPDVAAWEAASYSFDLDETNLYEVPVFRNKFMAMVWLTSKTGSTVEAVMIGHSYARDASFEAMCDSESIGTIDLRYQGRADLRNLIIEYCEGVEFLWQEADYRCTCPTHSPICDKIPMSDPGIAAFGLTTKKRTGARQNLIMDGYMRATVKWCWECWYRKHTEINPEF